MITGCFHIERSTNIGAVYDCVLAMLILVKLPVINC